MHDTPTAWQLGLRKNQPQGAESIQTMIWACLAQGLLSLLQRALALAQLLLGLLYAALQLAHLPQAGSWPDIIRVDI